MNKKIISKILATMLVITLTFANFVLLGVYASKSYALTDNLEKQGITTNDENVEFDAYFVDENRGNVHKTKQDINTQDMKLYLSVNVKKGYLKDALIKIFGENEEKLANFKILNSNESLELIEKIDLEKNQINLKQINKGTQCILEVPIVANKDDNFDLTNFNKENGIKLIGSFVNDEGKTVSITKTIKTKIEWNGTAKIELEQNVQRYIPFNVNEQKGTILQTVVKTKLENNNLPVEQTTLDVAVPVINGQKPQKVSVVANSTNATNGKNALEFNKNNWTYDATTGKLNITVKNEENSGIVSWKKAAIDEYVITYIYPEIVEPEKTTQTVKVAIKAYNNISTIEEKEISQEIELGEKVGELTTSNNISTEQLSKGYLYTKSEKETIYNVGTQIDIGYSNLIDKVEIENQIDNFINEQEEEFIINDSYYKATSINKKLFEKILGTDGSVVIKDQNGKVLTTFNKDTIEDENGNYTYNYEAKTNKITIQTTKPVQEGKLQINHQKAIQGTNYEKAQIQSFKNIKTNTNIKAILAEQEVSKTQAVSNINLIDPSTKIEASINKENLSTIVKNENVQIRVILKTNTIDCDLYKNPVIEIVLPTYIENLEIKDINLLFDEELKIKSHETYKNQEGNTVVKVVLEGENTKYNTDEVSKGANIVIDTDITLKQLTPTKQDLMKVYVTNENATTYETMKKVRSVPTSAYVETALNSVAPVGMVTTNTISSYNTKNETVTSISGQEGIGKLETRTDAKTATVSMNIINNYENPVRNINILGRILTAGSKDVVSNENLESNLETTLINALQITGIDASKVTIYYSTNEIATKDLTLVQNAWTRDITDLSKVKSYLVVLSDYEMNTGDALNLSYNINIPANLPHNQSAYANYIVYFDNIARDAQTNDSTKATKVGLTTGAGPELEASIKANVENGADVREGTRVTYTVTVKNVGKVDANNVVVKANVPEGAVYTEFVEGGEYFFDEYVDDYEKKEYSKTIQTLKAGETFTIEYNVKVKTIYPEYIFNNIIDLEEIKNMTQEELQKYISDNGIYLEDTENMTEEELRKYIFDNGIYLENTENMTEEELKDLLMKEKEVYLETFARITAEGLEKQIETEKIKNKAVEGYLNVEMEIFPNYIEGIVKEGDVIKYTTKIQNVNKNSKTDVVLKTEIPEGTTYKTAYILTSEQITEGITIDENTRTLEYNIGVLSGEDSVRVVLEVTVDKLSGSESEKQIKNMAQVTCKETDEIFTTKQLINRVLLPGLTVTTSDNRPDGKMTDEDTIEYYVEIKNVGKAIAKNITITDYIPEELVYETTKYIIDGKTTELKSGENVVNVCIDLEPSKTANVTIIARANQIDGKDPIQVENEIAVSCETAAFASINSFKHTITPTNKDIILPDGSIKEKTYNISGIAWLDSNSDGKRDETEEKLSNIEIMLINADNGQIIKDEAGNSRVVKTSSDGKYVFENISKGKYIVVFLYDVAKYDVTKYKAEGINESVNSDAVTMKLNLNGTIRNGAVSDAITLDSNIYNIDIGLIENPKFDLKLDKVITKITVNDSKGTNVHEYKDSRLAKLDLNPKTINSTTIAIEYKIRVTNEGAVAGYAKKIVDYLPQDMKFSSEINKDWYQAENGNVFNASLANTILNPGDTKELTLVLTKKMTENNTGVINNNAEIFEAYNDLGLKDIDSTPANSVQNEDDMSRADAIIGIKTGEIYVYITITMLSIGILGIGIYLINKKVLRKI